MNDAVKNSKKVVGMGAREELRLRVLRSLEANPQLCQRQLFAGLGVSFGGVNYALKALVERGFMKAENSRNSRSKIGYLYVLTPKGTAEKTSSTTVFLGRKLDEYEVLRQGVEALNCEIGSDGSTDSGNGAESR